MKEIPKSQINPAIPKYNLTKRDKSKDIISNVNEMPYIIVSLEKNEPGFIEKLVFVLKAIPGVIGILFKLINIYFIFRRAMMAENGKDLATNWVAIATGLATTGFTVLAVFGVIVPEDLQAIILTVLTAIIGAAVTVIAYFTGKSSPQYKKVA